MDTSDVETEEPAAMAASATAPAPHCAKNRLAMPISVVLLAIALGPMCLWDTEDAGGNHAGGRLPDGDHVLLQRSSRLDQPKGPEVAAKERRRAAALSVHETFLPTAERSGLLETFSREWKAAPQGVDLYLQAWKEQMVPALAVGLPTALLVLAFAMIYRSVREVPQQHLYVPWEPRGENNAMVAMRKWEYDLFELRECHQQDCSLCLMSFCCTPIRWADTISQPNMLEPRDLGWRFWPALCTWVVIVYLLSYFTFDLSMIIMLCLQIHYRQQIRRAYDINNSTCETLCIDCVLWCCCSPCAACQEARQVEQVQRAM